MASKVSKTEMTPPSTDASAQDLLMQYAGPNAAYYADQFATLSRAGFMPRRLNGAAMGLGPLWAAARGLWSWFWISAVGEIVALIVLGRGLWGPRGEDEPPGVQADTVLVGLILLIVVKLLEGLTANRVYQRRFVRWRIDRRLRAGVSTRAAMAGGLLMLLVYSLMVYRFSARRVVGFIATFPTTRQIGLRTASGIDSAVDWLTLNLETVFDTITHGVRMVLNFLELLFIGTP